MRKPTIDDVAARSGVARVTVSRVINNQPNVRAATRDKVLAAVAELGFAANIRARQLAGGRHNSILLLCALNVDQEPNSFYSSALEVGALRACAQYGFELVRHFVPHAGGGYQAAICDFIADNHCAGVIVTPPFSDDRELIEAIAQTRPVVCISPGEAPPAHASAVSIDDEAAGHAVAQHLLALGHRRLGFVKGMEHHRAAERRFRGALRALREAGLSDDSMVAERGNFTFRSGSEVLPRLLRQCPETSAIICANDDMAVGVLFAAHQQGLSVPRRLSITGFDDTPVSALVWPPLSTIHQPIADMSTRAVEMLGERLNHPGQTKAYHAELAFRLIERGSTAPPLS